MPGPFDMGANALLGIGQNTVRPIDAGDRISQFASTQNALLGNQVQQAEFDAQKARGNALRASIGQDGRPDQHAYLRRLADDPNGAYGLPDAVTTSQDQEARAIQNSDAGRNAIASVMSFIGRNPDHIHLSAGVHMAKSVLPKTQWGQVDAIARRVADHPDGIAGGIAQLTNSVQPAGVQQSNTYGTPGATINDGSQTIVGTQQSSLPGPHSGQFQPQTTVQQHASPEFERTFTPRTIMTPQGPKTIPMTNAQFAAFQGTTGDGGSQFSGRRVDVTGNGSDLPSTAIPVGAEDQAKAGLALKNSLATNMQSYRDEETNYRNIAGLLQTMASDTRFRGLKLAEASNLASKLGFQGDYATLAQELSKASAKTRQAMMDGGSGPHTNAGMEELTHISPSPEMTIPAALAVAHEGITAASQKGRRGQYAQGVENPMDVTRAISEYDAAYDPRFATIQRLGPQAGREYAKTHINDQAQYAASVRKMAQLQRDKGYDYGLTPQQIDKILGQKNGK